jgi:hypothetical protein
MRRNGLVVRGLTGSQKGLNFFLMGKFQHFLDMIRRIDADNNNRITAQGDDRITADSKY